MRNVGLGSFSPLVRPRKTCQPRVQGGVRAIEISNSVVCAQLLDDEIRHLAALGDWRLGEKLPNLRDDTWRLIQCFYKQIPLGLIDSEMRLIGQRLLGLLASALKNELRNIQTSTLRGNTNQLFLA